MSAAVHRLDDARERARLDRPATLGDLRIELLSLVGPPWPRRDPPCDLDAEGMVLSAMLDHGARPPTWLRPEHFYSEANAAVYAVAATWLEADDAPPDLATVARLIRRSGYVMADWPGYLVLLRDAQPACVRLDAAAERIVRLARRREVIDRLTVIAAELRDDTVPISVDLRRRDDIEGALAGRLRALADLLDRSPTDG
jgi:replicative DNA helicase